MSDDVTPTDLGGQGAGEGANQNASDAGSQILDRFDGPAWLTDMPEDLRDNASLRKFKDVQNLAQSYLNAERLIGRDKIPVPKTDEEFLVAARRMGAPEKAEDYGLSADIFPEQLHEQAQADVEWFSNLAVELGLTKNQATKLMSQYAERMQEGFKAQAANDEYQMAIARQELTREFGVDTDRQLMLANRTMTTFMSPDLQAKIINSGLGNDPELIKLLAALGSERLEEIGIDKNGSPVVNMNDLKDAISKAQSDPAYLDSSHPGHRKAVQKCQVLFEQLTNMS